MAQEKPKNLKGMDAEQTLAVVARNRQFTKLEAAYREPGDVPRETCGPCRFYLRDPGGGEIGKCQVVEGNIAWSGTSNLFISAAEEAEVVLTGGNILQPVGPETSAVVFVSGSPDEEEYKAAEVMTKESRELFEDLYLGNLMLPPGKVSIMFAVPIEKGRNPEEFQKAADHWSTWRNATIKKMGSPVVVALGRAAKLALGDAADFILPHPAAVLKHGDNKEVGRKMGAIRKEVFSRLLEENDHGENILDSWALDDTSSIHSPSGSVISIPIIKADEMQQMAFGIALSPYVVGDTQRDWLPAADIQKFAHGYQEKSRTPGYRHSRGMNAAILETSLIHYPTLEDEQKAYRNEPHNAYVIPYGNGVVRSGEWLVGMRYDGPEWQQVLSGELDSFSIGLKRGAMRIPTTTDEAPKVNFIELKAD